MINGILVTTPLINLFQQNTYISDNRIVKEVLLTPRLCTYYPNEHTIISAKKLFELFYKIFDHLSTVDHNSVIETDSKRSWKA